MSDKIEHAIEHAKHLMPDQKDLGMKERVGQFFDLPKYPQAKFMLLYHPAYLLRDPRKKPETLGHLKNLRAYLDQEGLYAAHQSAHH